jgi:transposase-like protein
LAKRQWRSLDFDKQIISMYARGMVLREIVGHVRDLCGRDVSTALVTDPVPDEIAPWQARSQDPIHPLVFFDALWARSATRTRRTMRPFTSRSAQGNVEARKSSFTGWS